MLIRSERHKSADLELWAELESADRVYADRLLRSGKIEKSLAAIREFSAAGSCYASVSWGKDSVCLAHMIRLHAPDIPLVYLCAVPVGNPLNDDVRDAFLAAYPGRYSEVIVDYRTIPDARGLSPDGLEAAKDRLFFGAFKSLPFGDRHVTGIRADESSGRKIRMKRWGLASINALAPLGWWTADDVFAYLALHDLPVHPSYAMLGNGRWNRKNIRVDELGGARGDQFGRAAWEREYYGDVMRRLDAMGCWRDDWQSTGR